MRDRLGRFVTEKPKSLVIPFVLLGFTWAFTNLAILRTGYLWGIREAETKNFKAQELSTQDRVNLLLEIMTYKTKCQRSWQILNDNPRDGRAAFKVLDE